MTTKMPWLKTRLRELDRTPTGLALHLDVAIARVYEMIAGKRGIQPAEIAPMAEYLEWPIDKVLEKLPKEARVMPTTISHAPNRAGMSAVLGLIPVLGTTRTPPQGVTRTRFNRNPMCCDMVLTGETVQRFQALPALQGRDDIYCLYMHAPTMTPWRDRGELVMFEMKRPPKDLDHVVIYLLGDEKSLIPVLVRQLLKQNGNKLKVRQYNPSRDSEIDMKTVASIYRVLTWDDVVR